MGMDSVFDREKYLDIKLSVPNLCYRLLYNFSKTKNCRRLYSANKLATTTTGCIADL